MSSRELFKAVFIRHGATDYTDIYPDITVRGQSQLTVSARQIKAFCAEQPLRFFSSPQARARGSAQHLADCLGHREPVVCIAAIDAVRQRQPIVCQQIMARYAAQGGSQAVDRGYFTDPRWEDPAIIEPKSEIKRRFYRYLARLISGAQHEPCEHLGCCLVHVSHVEVICHLLINTMRYDFARHDPVRCAEAIYATFCRDPAADHTTMEVVFRRKKISTVFCT